MKNEINIVKAKVYDIDDTTKKVVFDVGNEHTFSMMYITFLTVIDELSITEIRVLTWCTLNCVYNRNIVNLNTYSYTQIQELYNISYQTCRNIVSTLTKKQMLVRISKGTYRINPRYFWKGLTKDREGVLKLMIETECSTC